MGKKLSLIQCRGNKITDCDGNNIGSWMNMEYYLYGVYGAERILRKMALDILGKEKGEFIFESMMKNFFNEKDVRWLKSIGNTVMRLTLIG